MRARMVFAFAVLALGGGVAGPRAMAGSPGAIDLADRMNVAEAVFPETVSWVNVGSLPAVNADGLSPGVRAGMVRDFEGPPVAGSPCAAVTELPAGGAGDFFGPGDDDAMFLSPNFCAAGASTWVWRHVHDARRISHVVTRFTVERIEPGVAPRFLETDGYSGAPEMFYHYFVGSDVGSDKLPAGAVEVNKLLVVPAAAKIANGRVTLGAAAMLMWGPWAFDAKDPELAGDLAEFGADGAAKLDIPAGSVVAVLRVYRNSAGEIWRLVALEGREADVRGHVVGWVRG